MPNPDDVTFVIKGKDEASGVFKKISGNILKTGQALLAGAGLAVGGLAALTKGLAGLAAEAEPIVGVESAFNDLTKSVVGGSDRMLGALQRQSRGWVTDADLMKNYNLAASLIGKTFAEELPDAMGVLTKVSVATGQDMNYMLDSLVRGVGRLSPLILDNLGVQATLAEATERATEMFGKQADQLTKNEQQMGMFNVVMEKLRENTKDVELPDMEFRKFEVTLHNLRHEIGAKLLPTFGPLMSLLGRLAELAGHWVVRALDRLTQYTEPVGHALTWLWDRLEAGDGLFDIFEDGSSILGGFFEKLGLGEKAAERLARQIRQVRDDLVDFFDRARDALAPIWDWISANIKLQDVLTALGILLGVGILSVLWKLAVAFGPILLVIGAVIGAVALLRKAWEDDWLGIRTKLTEAWYEHIQPALETAREWLEDKIPRIVDWLKEKWESLKRTAVRFYEALVEWTEPLRDWVTENVELKDVLIGLGIALGILAAPVVIAALGALATAVATVVTTAGPIIALVVGMIAAVNLFRRAWEGDWGGLRTKLTEAWEGHILPALTDMWEWFKEKLPEAWEAVKKFWEKHLQPALEAVGKFIVEKVIPAIGTLVLWLAEKIPAAVAAVRRFWLTKLQPALKTVWEFIRDKVIPKLIEVYNWLKDKWTWAVAKAREMWEEHLKPALKKVWNFIVIHVIPALKKVWTWLKEKWTEAVDKAKDWWENHLKPALKTVWGFIVTHVIPKLKVVYEWLKEKWTEAVDKAKEWWEEHLKPALVTVRDYIWEQVIPRLIDVWHWLKNKWTEAVDQVQEWWEEHLQPALEMVVEYIKDPVLPTLQDLADKLNDDVAPAIGDVAYVWAHDHLESLIVTMKFIAGVKAVLLGLADILNSVVYVAIETVRWAWMRLTGNLDAIWKLIKEHVLPLFVDLREELETRLAPIALIVGGFFGVIRDCLEAIWNWLTKVNPETEEHTTKQKDLKKALEDTNGPLITFRDVIDWIAGILPGIAEWLHKLAEAIRGLPDFLPDWFEHHSPSPIEQTLMGMGAGLRDVIPLLGTYGAAIRALPSGAGVGSGFGGGVIGPPASDVRFQLLAALKKHPAIQWANAKAFASDWPAWLTQRTMPRKVAAGVIGEPATGGRRRGSGPGFGGDIHYHLHYEGAPAPKRPQDDFEVLKAYYGS